MSDPPQGGLPEQPSVVPAVPVSVEEPRPDDGAAESDGTCALLTNDQVRCWGEDDYGQLGNGPANDGSSSDLPVPVQNVTDTVQGTVDGVTQPVEDATGLPLP